MIRDVNSREIAFLGRESQFPRLSISPEYVPFTDMIGVGSPAGARRDGGRSPAGPQRCSRPTPGRHRSINIAGSGAPKRHKMGGECYRGRVTGDAQWPIGLRTTGRVIAARPCQTPLDNRSTSWADRRMKRRVSGAVVHALKHRLGMRREDTIADRPLGMGNPRACGRTWPDDRPTSQWSFLFPIQADSSGCICTAGPIQWRN